MIDLVHYGTGADTYYLDIYEIIGTNIISNTLNLHTNNQLLTTKKLNIFNTLGQLIMTIAVDNTETHLVDVSYLSNGLYYITTPNFQVEPLKFSVIGAV